MIQKEIEKNSLIVSSIVNLMMAGAGIWVFVATGIQALFLDGVFSLIGFASAIFACIISKKSKKKTKVYPDGLYFLEPLYAILKSILTLTLLVISVISTAMVAYDYFYHGSGEAMNIGPVLPYTVCMVILCFGLSFFNRRQNKRINNISTILTAESKSNFIDGILSLGVGIAIILLKFIDINGAFGFLHYTGDFFVTTILVIISLKAPIVVLIHSFIELSNGATSDKEVENNINIVVNKHLSSITKIKQCDIFKVGMHIKVRIILPDKINQDIVWQLESAREKILGELKIKYSSLELSFNF